MLSIYQLKPRFQALLRPAVRSLAQRGVSANAVTLLACLLSVTLGAVLCAFPHQSALFLLLPLWMFIRMAFNAVDGMLAREFGYQSPLGAYLNELSDVVSDAALYLPFALVAPFNVWLIGLLIFLAALSEMAGALGPMIGAQRRYDGPIGKSDRAFVFGALGLWFGLAGSLPQWSVWLVPLLAAGIAANTVNRVRRAIASISPAS